MIHIIHNRSTKLWRISRLLNGFAEFVPMHDTRPQGRLLNKERFWLRKRDTASDQAGATWAVATLAVAILAAASASSRVLAYFRGVWCYMRNKFKPCRWLQQYATTGGSSTGRRCKVRSGLATGKSLNSNSGILYKSGNSFYRDIVLGVQNETCS